MSLDENIDEEEKKDDDNNKEDKQNKPKNQEQRTKEKDGKHEEMSIESGVPDLESETKDSNKSEEEIEL